jgi:CBS domain-containing protein
LQIMAEHDIGAVAVMEGGRLIGLLTEREYARRIVLEGRKSRNTPFATRWCRSC